MRLTGLPLLLLTALLLIVVAAATARWWRSAAVRITGLILAEVLVVAGAGLIANRSQNFYPTWQALAGHVPPVAVAASTGAGRLDARLAAGGPIAWSPPEAAGWHLAAAPVLVASPEYTRAPDRLFPVVVVLCGAAGVPRVQQWASRADRVLTVILVPTRATSGSALASLPSSLRRDARAGTDVITLHDPDPADLDAAVRDLPEPLAAPLYLPPPRLAHEVRP